MKYFFTLILLLLIAGQLSAQYPPVDSARQIIRNGKTPFERFRGYHGLDRYYYTTGIYDSSSIAQGKKCMPLPGKVKKMIFVDGDRLQG